MKKLVLGVLLLISSIVYSQVSRRAPVMPAYTVEQVIHKQDSILNDAKLRNVDKIELKNIKRERRFMISRYKKKWKNYLSDLESYYGYMNSYLRVVENKYGLSSGKGIDTYETKVTIENKVFYVVVTSVTKNTKTGQIVDRTVTKYRKPY